MRRAVEKEETIKDATWKAGVMSWHRQLIERFCGTIFRFTIMIDSYKSQSFARVEVWSVAKGEWSMVYETPGYLLTTTDHAKADFASLDAEIDELRRVARAVVL